MLYPLGFVGLRKLSTSECNRKNLRERSIELIENEWLKEDFIETEQEFEPKSDSPL